MKLLSRSLSWVRGLRSDDESRAGEHELSCVQFSQTVYRQQTGIITCSTTEVYMGMYLFSCAVSESSMVDFSEYLDFLSSVMLGIQLASENELC